MKKILGIFVLGLLLLVSGCTANSANDKKYLELEQDMEEISTQLYSLQSALEIVDLLQIDLETRFKDVLEENKDMDQKIKELQKQRGDLYNQIASLTQKLETLEQQTGNVKLFLAKEYHLVPGDNFQLFYRSIVQAVNPYNFYIKLSGSKGHAYNRYYEFKPEASDAGKTYTLQVDICDNFGKVLTTATTNLVVSAVSKEEGTKTILAIGDSLTANGFWVSYGAEKYKAAGGTDLNFVGTISGGYGGKNYLYEGRSGWQWSGYTDTSTGPFRSLTNAYRISFKDYCTRNGFDDIDELYILMTWNGIGGKMREFQMGQEPFLSAKKLIDQFHEDFPEGKVTLLGIPQPSVNAGLGAYYTINQSYGDNYAQFVTALNYNKTLEDWTNMEGYRDFIRYVDVKGQFDSEYNMPTTPKPVNNQSTVTEPVGDSMGMHPLTQGYLQIGDAFYRALSKKWD